MCMGERSLPRQKCRNAFNYTFGAGSLTGTGRGLLGLNPAHGELTLLINIGAFLTKGFSQILF